MNKKRAAVAIITVVLLVISAFAVLLYVKNAESKEAEETVTERETEKAAIQENVINDVWHDVEQREYQLADHVYSHRGASGEEIEHTIAAYDKAIEQGSHNIEQDLVLSAEGTLYVSHDLTSDRITGRGGYYINMTDDQIDKLRTSDGQKILKLSEVFDRYGRSVEYIIELKDFDSETIRAFKELVDEYGMKNNIVIQCFELETLKQLELYYPDMPKLYLVKDKDSLYNGLTKEYVDIIAVESSLMTTANCNATHEKGKKFNVWTLNTEGEIKAAIDIGVDSYFTDYTENAISYERKYRN